MNNNPNFLFGMYEPTTDSVIVKLVKIPFSLSVARNVILRLSLRNRMISPICTMVGKKFTAYICQARYEGQWLAGLCRCYERI